jgi:predicted nucleic acid-binding protein
LILVDTGPLVALFEPRDPMHQGCKTILKMIVKGPLWTTVPVLTEAFHMLDPGSRGSENLRQFVQRGGTSLWFMDQTALSRCFELMKRYADHPMDLADASLITAAESLPTRKIFTIDRDDFSTYRIRHGHRHEAVEILGSLP